MHRSLALALLLALTLAGCVSTQPVPLTSPEGRAEVNARAERGPAVLFLTGEPGRHVRALHMAPDVTTWIDPQTQEARSAPTSDVVRVTFLRPGAGALKGLAVGAGAGTAFALMASTEGDSGHFFSPPPTIWVPFGAVVGVLIGGAYSDRHVYRPAPEAPAGR